MVFRPMVKELEKIFLALGHEQAEKKLQSLLDEVEDFEYEIVATAVHREQIASEILSKRPSILVLREGLPGNLDIFLLMRKIVQSLPQTRVVFLAGDRKPGDPELAKIVAYRIYDILPGTTVNVRNVANLIIHPRSFEDAVIYLPSSDKDELFSKEELEEKDVPEQIIGTNTETTILIKNEIDSTPASNPAEDVTIVQPKDPKSKSNPLNFVKALIPKGNEKPSVDVPQVPSQPPTPPPEPQPQPSNEVAPPFVSVPPVQPQPPVQPVQSPPQKGIFSRFGGGGIREIQKNINGRIVTAKQQVVTFYSAKAGIGTTSVALNAAIEASRRLNQRVLLIEFNQKSSALSYWFDMPNEGYGLEDALIGISSQDYNNITNAIITKEKLLKYEDSNFHDNYPKFPDTLDYLFFSDSYMRKHTKDNVATQTLQDLLLFCLYQLNYDEVFIDISADAPRELAESCLILSGKNVILMSQDVAIINNSVIFFAELNRRGLKFDIGCEERDSTVTNKNIYVLNKYSYNSTFTQKRIKQWIKCKNLCIIPENGAELNSLLSIGYMPLDNAKDKQFKESYKFLGNLIEE